VTPTNGITGPSLPSALGALTVTPSAGTGSLGLTNTLTNTVLTTGVLTGGEAITPAGTLTQPLTATPDPLLDTQYTGVLEGTIIANRTEANVRFFVEGQVYDLAPLRALGLPLPRPTAVLNLFNCDARQSETEAGCFWDPYLLKQNGFYEVVTGAETGALVSLSLREAGAPPANQIWVQNRTGERESIVVNNEVIEIAPASVQQFTLAEGQDPVLVYLRNCITQGAQTACEWAPQGVDRGYYYALVKLSSVGAGNMTVTTAQLEGIVASSGEVVEQPPQASCVLRVPTLNVRSGPGLEFPVIAKVRGTEEQPGSVVVVGFDASKQWMEVSDRVALGGWVTSNPDFIVCTGDLAVLPVQGGDQATAITDTAATTDTTSAPATDTATTTESTDAVAEAAPAEDTPEPVVEQPVEEVVTEPTADVTEPTAEPTPAPPAVPPGQVRLTISNQFEREVRFTMDQAYRVERDNLSGEWDLQPGQSVSILVYPGMVPFSVSSPWNELGGNANLTLEPDTERALYITFIPDPDGSGDWILQHW
jgi:hypothetical protein